MDSRSSPTLDMTGGDTNGNHPLFDFIGQNIHSLGDRVQLEALKTRGTGWFDVLSEELRDLMETRRD